MADDEAESRSGGAAASEVESDALPQFVRRVIGLTEQFVHVSEAGAAAVFAILFAIGVVDLANRIVQAVLSGRIIDPVVVIDFVDVGLLLLIIVEVYRTVIAYLEDNETREIVRLIIYTGIIAMVRKAIIFRTDEYATAQDALFAAVSYTIIIFGLVALLFAERVYG